MPRVKDLTNKTFGYLTVIRQEGINNQNRAMWLCRCICGNEKRISSHDLQNKTISCGCIGAKMRLKNLEKGRGWNKKSEPYLSRPKQKTKSKNPYKRLNKIWDGMKSRCYNNKHIHFNSYGGRGIKICTEWLTDFSSFKKWAIENGYDDNLCIDRIDFNGNYEPSNCRWVTYKQNSNNTRRNHLITIDGETRTLQQWADMYGINNTTISERIRRGRTGNELLKKPRPRKNMPRMS